MDNDEGERMKCNAKTTYGRECSNQGYKTFGGLCIKHFQSKMKLEYEKEKNKRKKKKKVHDLSL